MKKKSYKNNNWHKILIRNLVFPMKIGIYKHEKFKEQRVRVNLELRVYQKKGSIDDRIDNVICYEDIIKLIKNIASSKHLNLVETLANKLANKFEKINQVKEIFIKVSKCEIIKEETDIGFILNRLVKK